MAKPKTRFVCRECGAEQPGWMGRCPTCGEWNTLEEVIPSPGVRIERSLAGGQVSRLAEISPSGRERIQVPIGEFARVLGGGLVPGAVTLLSGDPGIGKSTLLLQLAATMSAQGHKTLYVSAEESAHQIKLRADRLSLKADDLYISSEICMDTILTQIGDLKPTIVVVDSIQTVYLEDVSSSAGSVTQVRECAAALVRAAKTMDMAVFLVGHVTKAGSIAGPRLLEHIVDTVLYMEGERFHSYRLLRSVKNRFGSTDEVGVFEMREEGMVEVPNPSQVFLEERLGRATGSAIAVTMEGTRPLLVEVQALASTSNLPHPRRTANGFDINRVLLLAAVLAKRVGLALNDQDIFVNVVGGLRVGEPAVDLPAAVAMASSHYNRPVREGLAMFGEVGLSGELRSVGQSERRINEARKLGFDHILMPPIRNSSTKTDGVAILGVRTLSEAVDLALQK